MNNQKIITKEINKAISELINSLDFKQWKNLSIIRKEKYPISYSDKRTLIISIIH